MSSTLASSPEPTLAPSPAAEPRARRVLRFLAFLTLALAVSLVTGLFLLSQFPLLNGAIEELMSSHSGNARDARTAAWYTMTIIVLIPTVLLLTVWRLKLRSWWWVGGGWLLITPVLVYLATDDPVVRHPLTIEELSPAFPGAEKSFEVIMRYGRQQPAAKAFTMTTVPAGMPDPTKPGEWRDYALMHRAAFTADWEALAPQRAWWAELNSFDRIGDLTSAGPDAEVISFHVFRAIGQRGCLVATLQAIDGHGDDAIDTLLPILQVTRKMQPSSRTLVRIMVGIVIERLALRTAHWVLEHAAVSPAARARLAAVVQGGMGEAGARRIITIDYAGILGHLVDNSLGDFVNNTDKSPVARFALNAISPFVYNQRASANLYGTFLVEFQELAARREIDRMARRGDEFSRRDLHPRFKNFMGYFVINAAFPAYIKLVDSYWSLEDQRQLVRERLARP